MRIRAQHVRAWEATSGTRARTWRLDEWRPGRSRGEEARPREARVAGKGTRCWGGAAAGAEGASEDADEEQAWGGGEVLCGCRSSEEERGAVKQRGSWARGAEERRPRGRAGWRYHREGFRRREGVNEKLPGRRCLAG
jgi:hypothetical protein